MLESICNFYLKHIWIILIWIFVIMSILYSSLPKEKYAKKVKDYYILDFSLTYKLYGTILFFIIDIPMCYVFFFTKHTTVHIIKTYIIFILIVMLGIIGSLYHLLYKVYVNKKTIKIKYPFRREILINWEDVKRIYDDGRHLVIELKDDKRYKINNSLSGIFTLIAFYEYRNK